jgi:hypothetical protein
MNCRVCGTPNPEGVAFCINCGTSFAETCAVCGAARIGNARFCGNCGNRFPDVAAPGDEAPFGPIRSIGRLGRGRVFGGRDVGEPVAAIATEASVADPGGPAHRARLGERGAAVDAEGDAFGIGRAADATVHWLPACGA